MYKFVVSLIKYIFIIFNGPVEVQGLENLPDEPAIYAITHRSALDPFYMAIIALPKEIAFMGKKELFDIKILGWLLPKFHVFAINREKPSTKVMKHAVNVMNQDGLNLGIFPSGSRYTTEIKGGTAFIQRMSQRDIVPISLQCPRSFGDFISRKKAKAAIGQPITYNHNIKYDKAQLEIIDQQIAKEFDDLDKAIDPNYVYIPKKKNK